MNGNIASPIILTKTFDIWYKQQPDKTPFNKPRAGG